MPRAGSLACYVACCFVGLPIVTAVTLIPFAFLHPAPPSNPQVFAHLVPDPAANPPVVNVNMDTGGRFAFVEFQNRDMATKALEMDKVGGVGGGGGACEQSAFGGTLCSEPPAHPPPQPPGG